MSALLVSIALLFSPVQDSVSVEKYEELESRLDNLEERVIRQEAEGEAISDVLYGERAWWAGLITILVGLITVAGYRQFVNEVEDSKNTVEEIRDKALEKVNEVESGLNKLDTELKGLRDRYLGMEQDQFLRRYSETKEQGRLLEAIRNNLNLIRVTLERKPENAATAEIVSKRLELVIEDAKKVSESKPVQGRFATKFDIGNTISEIKMHLTERNLQKLEEVEEILKETEHFDGGILT